MRHRPIPLVALLMAAALLAGGGRRAAGEGVTAGRPNRLIGESSPYLLLHAHNPVDWYPWGEEALKRARREQRPIFLSVGYSTCYWCHVMEREVFSNPEIAALMNRWFVSIKVDREERPELDEIYMTATQLLTRRGGWPNSVFLTPDLEPFFAGTYFPPEDSRGRPGFPRILEGLSRLWKNDRPRVLAHASRIASSLQEAIAEARQPAAAVPAPEVADRAVAELARRYDEDFGGFGAAPKFPSPARLYLLWQRAENGDGEARRMVLGTLRRMGQGAIYDHLDGGFHRYAMDREWRVPHFEKMLYDNAHLGELLAITAAATGDPELERLARGTFDFVLDRLRLPNGAFKSAIDAETDAVEGAYYIWTREEFAQAAGKKGYALLAPIFGIDGDPNLEEDHYTLYLTRPLGAHAEGLGMGREELLARMAPHLGALRRARSRRELPFVDDKVLTDWNGMMIAALASGGELLSEPRYLAAAASAADFVLTLRDDGGVQLHAWRNGRAKIPAFLDDYAFLVRGLLALHRVTGEARWLREAVRLSEQLESRLRAPGGGYYTSEARPDLLFQALSSADGAIPSGNGIAALNQLQLAEQSGKEPFRRRAEASLKAFAADLESHPQGVPSLALAVYRHGGAGTGAATTATGGGAKPRGVRRMQELARQVVAASASLGDPAGADGWRQFEVELEIREGWHVNANPASQEFLVPTRLEGEVRGVEYPPGESFQFDFAPDEIRVYSGSSWLRGEVRAEQKELRLRYQACDDRRCLPPVTETLSLR